MRTVISTLLALLLASLTTSTPLIFGSISSAQVPLNGLPPPPSNKVPKYIVLGYGTQNYTCASSISATKPVAVGAVADLYDIAPLFALRGKRFPVHQLPGLALDLGAQIDRLPVSVRKIGYHYFNADGPVFVLDHASPPAAIGVRKADGRPAPPDAHPGLAGEGAVDWLLLVDNLKGLTFGGIDTTYRVVTAGGKPPATCEGVGPSFQVQYATEYWFFGPQ
jgi:hypothetical protein